MSWGDFITGIAPTALQNTWGQKFLFAFGFTLDVVQEWVSEGLNARMRSLADPSALPYSGRDVGLIQGFDESSASFALRQRAAIDSWTIAGSAWSVIRQVKGYLTGHQVQIATVTSAKGSWNVSDASGNETVLRGENNWNWQGDASTLWSKSWVIIWPESSGVIAAGPTCGSGAKCGQKNLTLGTTATPAQVSSIREIVRQFKGAGRTVVNIIIALDPTSFAPTSAPGAPMPDGTWGSDGKYVGGTKVPARLLTARYWDGTAQTHIST